MPISNNELEIVEVDRDGDTTSPAWWFFFLVDAENEDVFVSADGVDKRSRMFLRISGDVFTFPREHEIIGGRDFVSMKALAEDDPKYTKIRINILAHFGKVII